MTALRTQVALHTVHSHVVVCIEDRRQVIAALHTAERTGSFAICFNYVAMRALYRTMGLEEAVLTIAQENAINKLAHELAAPFINRRLVTIARRAAGMSRNAMDATKH